MAVWNKDVYQTRTTASAAEIDVGLRKHMLGIYNYMAAGVLLTGIVALWVANSPSAMQTIFGTPLKYVVMLAPLGFVLVLSFGINKLGVGAAQALFWLFSAVMGLSLASIFMVYTGGSIARVFFITAGTFAAMSLYGYTTKADLSKFGSFLIMGLIGVVLASLVNMFIGSSALQFAISVVGVLVFVGLTAWDTQRIKEDFYEGDSYEIAAKKSVMGALTLYLDFINLFMMLLSLMGGRKE